MGGPFDRIPFESACAMALPPPREKPACIIQARMGSTRLPGKSLAGLEGDSVLARVVQRVAAALGVGTVAVATGDTVRDDPIAAECERLRVECVRGPEDDVLARYVIAARALGAGAVVRITGDCPLIPPEVIDAVVGAWQNGGDRYDYGGNTLRRTFPDGMDAEVFTLEVLDRLAETATGSDREHVTSLLVADPSPFRCVNVELPSDLSDVRMTLDTPEDLETIREIWRRAAAGGGPAGIDELIALEAETRAGGR